MSRRTLSRTFSTAALLCTLLCMPTANAQDSESSQSAAQYINSLPPGTIPYMYIPEQTEHVQQPPPPPRREKETPVRSLLSLLFLSVWAVGILLRTKKAKYEVFNDTVSDVIVSFARPVDVQKGLKFSKKNVKARSSMKHPFAWTKDDPQTVTSWLTVRDRHGNIFSFDLAPYIASSTWDRTPRTFWRGEIWPIRVRRDAATGGLILLLPQTDGTYMELRS